MRNLPNKASQVADPYSSPVVALKIIHLTAASAGRPSKIWKVFPIVFLNNWDHVTFVCDQAYFLTGLIKESFSTKVLDRVDSGKILGSLSARISQTVQAKFGNGMIDRIVVISPNEFQSLTHQIPIATY